MLSKPLLWRMMSSEKSATFRDHALGDRPPRQRASGRRGSGRRCRPCPSRSRALCGRVLLSRSFMGVFVGGAASLPHRPGRTVLAVAAGTGSPDALDAGGLGGARDGNDHDGEGEWGSACGLYGNGEDAGAGGLGGLSGNGGRGAGEGASSAAANSAAADRSATAGRAAGVIGPRKAGP